MVLVKFTIGDNLRFLSHAELTRVFERACARGAVNIRFSQGLNPRPKLSLPLPKSVGVSCSEELLVMRFEEADIDCDDLKARLARQLPRGCELIGVTWVEKDACPMPTAATYLFEVGVIRPIDRIRAVAEQVMAGEHIVLERVDDRFRRRAIDVRPFIRSIEIAGSSVMVCCSIYPTGTIRVDEIMKLLGLNIEDLASPVLRTNIQWQMN